MGRKAQIINPPNRLKSKVTTGGPGAVDAAVLARAESVMKNMADDYVKWADKDVTEIERLVGELVPGGADLAEQMDAIYRRAHDVKGQGGSFGYQLMTDIGALICGFIKSLDGNDLTAEDIELLKLCAESMRVVLDSRLTGDGGVPGRKVLDGLSKVSHKIHVAE